MTITAEQKAFGALVSRAAKESCLDGVSALKLIDFARKVRAEPVADGPWKALFFRTAIAANCLPSSFVDANDHVIKAIDALRVAPVAPSAPASPAAGVATAIHYPECWDTAAYPTVESALAEVYGAFKCTESAIHTKAAPSATPADLTCKCRQLGDWKGFHHPLCDASRATPADHSERDAVIEECALIAEKHADGTGYADDCTAAIRALKSAPSNGAWVKTGAIGGVSATMAVFPNPVLMRLPLPADGDSAETRTAFREYDAREPVADRTPWQIWRDALAYAATRNAPAREPVKPRAPRGPALQVDDNGDLS